MNIIFLLRRRISQRGTLALKKLEFRTDFHNKDFASNIKILNSPLEEGDPLLCTERIDNNKYLFRHFVTKTSPCICNVIRVTHCVGTIAETACFRFHAVHEA